MKTLKTLIRLHKKQIDDLVKEIGLLEEQRRRFVQSLEDLKKQVVIEIKHYAGSEYVFMLDNYLKSAEKNRKRLIIEIAQAEKNIESLRDILREQFGELKKFEIAMQKRQYQEKIKLLKEESKLMDEFGITKFNVDKNNQ